MRVLVVLGLGPAFCKTVLCRFFRMDFQRFGDQRCFCKESLGLFGLRPVNESLGLFGLRFFFQ